MFAWKIKSFLKLIFCFVISLSNSQIEITMDTCIIKYYNSFLLYCHWNLREFCLKHIWGRLFISNKFLFELCFQSIFYKLTWASITNIKAPVDLKIASKSNDASFTSNCPGMSQIWKLMKEFEDISSLKILHVDSSSNVSSGFILWKTT